MRSRTRVFLISLLLSKLSERTRFANQTEISCPTELLTEVGLAKTAPCIAASTFQVRRRTDQSIYIYVFSEKYVYATTLECMRGLRFVCMRSPGADSFKLEKIAADSQFWEMPVRARTPARQFHFSRGKPAWLPTRSTDDPTGNCSCRPPILRAD